MVEVNFATTKKFMTESGSRVSKDAVRRLQSHISVMVKEVVDKAKEIAEGKRKKTILIDHLEKAISELEE